MIIPQLHALAFLLFLVGATTQQVRTRTVSPFLVYSGVAVSLSLRAMVGVDQHMWGLLGLSAALLLAIVLLVLHAASGSELRLLLLVGAFLGPRDTLTTVLVATGVMLAAALVGALLSRVHGWGARATQVLMTPYDGVRWSGGRLELTVAAEVAVARAAPMSPGLAIVLGAMAGWIL